MDDGVADLHMHTTASDGTCSVDDRLIQARDRGLDAIAITDHDIISEALLDRVSDAGNVELVTGVEVRADVHETKVELLGYYIDPDDDRLAAVLEQVRGYRRERNRRMIDRLHERADLQVSYEEVRERADGLLARPHIADVLVEEGIVDSVSAAFGTYLGSDGDAFVPMERVPAAEAIDAIHGADGIVSLAHPGRVRTTDIDAIVAELVTQGLDAIEVQYPYDPSPDEGYADVTVADAATFAETFDLLRTGGSDCHGPDSGKFRIGQVRIARDDLEALRDRADKRSPL